METKHCPCCEASKPLTEFGTRHKRGALKPADYCKACCNQKSKEAYVKNIESRIAYRRQYKEANREALRQSRRNYYRRCVELGKVSKPDPVKQRARNQLQQELRMGRMVKPEACEVCFTKPESRKHIHAHHHKGYDFPLDVQWVCTLCHGKAHRAETAVAA